MKLKRNMTRNIIAFFFILALSCSFTTYLMILWHESAHSEIYRMFGVDSKIVVSLFEGYTETLNQTENCNENNGCLYLQGLNDIVGYHFSGFIISLWLIMFAGFSFVILILLPISMKK